MDLRRSGTMNRGLDVPPWPWYVMLSSWAGTGRLGVLLVQFWPPTTTQSMRAHPCLLSPPSLAITQPTNPKSPAPPMHPTHPGGMIHPSYNQHAAGAAGSALCIGASPLLPSSIMPHPSRLPTGTTYGPKHAAEGLCPPPPPCGATMV